MTPDVVQLYIAVVVTVLLVVQLFVKDQTRADRTEPSADVDREPTYPDGPENAPGSEPDLVCGGDYGQAAVDLQGTAKPKRSRAKKAPARKRASRKAR